MSDATLITKFGSEGYETSTRQLDTYVQKAGAAAKATDALAGASRGAATATAQLAAEAQRSIAANAAAAAGMAKLAQAEMQISQAMRTMPAIHTAAAAGAKLHSHELLNLSRQFSDIGVTAAMGMNPLMILIQQGPQIAETLAMAAKRGVTFKGALADMAASASGLLTKLGPLVGIVGAIGAAVGLAIAAFSIWKKQVAETQAALASYGTVTAEANAAMQDTAKYTGEAELSMKLFAGETGVAAGALFTLAQRNREAAISTLMLKRAQLVDAQKDMRANTTEALWAKGNGPITFNPRELIGQAASVLKAGASLFDPQGQEQLKTGISGVTSEINKLEAEILRLANLDGEAFVKNGTSGLRATEAAAKKAAEELKRLKELQESFFSGDYVRAWMDLQDARAARTLVAQKALDPKNLENAAAKAGEAVSAAMEKAAEDARQAFNYALDDFESGIRNRDWMQSFAGLFMAIRALKKSWGEMTTSDRINGVASIASSIGGAAGGTAGRALGGAASGAMAGLTLTGGNPIGAAIGAVVGGIASLFSSSSAKKAQKAQEEAQRAADAASIAQQTLNQYRQIEIERLTLLGDATAVRALQLEGERAGIAAGNLARFDELVALREEAGLRELRIQLLEAEGKTAEANAMRQADALKLLTPAQQEMTRAIWAATEATNARLISEAAYAQAVTDADQAISKAEQDLTAARRAEAQEERTRLQEIASAAQSARDRLKGFHDSLVEFDRSLTGSGSGLGGSYRAARGAFTNNASRAMLGDADAQGQFVALGQAYAEAAKSNAPTQLDYLRDLADIRKATEAARLAAGRQIDVQQAQLDAANAGLAALATVNDSVLTVAQATANLAAALQIKANLTGVANDNMGGGAYNSATESWSASTVTKADLDRAAAAGIGVSGPAGDSRAYLIDGYRSGLFDHLRDADGNPTGIAAQLKAAGFARGGFHGGGLRIVGEQGPELEATGPARIWNADQTSAMLGGGDDSAVVAAVDRLGAKIDNLGTKLDTGNGLTEKILKLWRFLTDDGDAMRTAA